MAQVIEVASKLICWLPIKWLAVPLLPLPMLVLPPMVLVWIGVTVAVYRWKSVNVLNSKDGKIKSWVRAAECTWATAYCVLFLVAIFVVKGACKVVAAVPLVP